MDRATGRVVAEAPALPADRTYPKERALAELALRERDRGWRALVYAVHTETRDITPRLRAVREGAGLRVAVLKAAAVKPEAREEWVARQVAAGLDVLIAPPRCVQTGLDLVDFPTIFWAEIEYSVYTLRQASRRSWRIGQAQPVEAYFAIYDGTMQAEALALVGRKPCAALLVDGELSQDGLATQERDDGDLMLTLPKRLAAGERADAQALESLFAESLALEAGAGAALDGDTWGDGDGSDRGWAAPDQRASTPGAFNPPQQQLTFPALPPASPTPPIDAPTVRGDANRLPAYTADHGSIGPVPAGREDRFAPSTGKVVPLVGHLVLTAPPAAPRRRRTPAHDQLKLFG